MTFSEMCPSHVTLTLTLFVQGYTVFYVYLCIYVCSRWISSNYIAALQSGHTAFSGFLYILRDRAFIFGMYVPYDKAFPVVHVP